jgi:hypothetical protein
MSTCVRNVCEIIFGNRVYKRRESKQRRARGRRIKVIYVGGIASVTDLRDCPEERVFPSILATLTSDL